MVRLGVILPFSLSRRRPPRNSRPFCFSWLRPAAAGGGAAHPPAPAAGTLLSAIRLTRRTSFTSFPYYVLNPTGQAVVRPYQSHESPPTDSSSCHRRSLSTSAKKEPQRHQHQHQQHALYDEDTIARATQTAEQLLDLTRYPVGSFKNTDFMSARHVLDVFKDLRVTKFVAVNASLRLLERLVQELAHNNSQEQQQQAAWICDPRYYTPLISNWKESSRGRRKIVISATQLTQMMQGMSKMLPEFKVDIVPFAMILYVLVKFQTNPQEAPLVAQGYLDRLFRHYNTDKKHATLEADAHIYSILLQAWAQSGLPEAPKKVEYWFERMQKLGLANHVVTYNVLLRFWASQGHVERVQALLENMQKLDGVQPDTISWSEAVLACLKRQRQQQHKNDSPAVWVERAEEYLKRMMDPKLFKPNNDFKVVGERIHDILAAHRSLLTCCSASEQDNILYRASALVQLVDGRTDVVLDQELFEQIISTFVGLCLDMDQDRVDKVMAVFDQGKRRDAARLVAFVMALGANSRADLASELLHRVLEDKDLSRGNALNAQVFGTVIDAWANSSSSSPMGNPVQEAKKIIQLMDENPLCHEWNIRPNYVVFNSLLKCIATQGARDAGEEAEAILLREMPQRNIKPNESTFETVIRSYLASGDLDRAESLARQFRVISGTPSSIQTYVRIMKHWADRNSTEAAERTELLLEHVKDGETSKPGAPLYNVVLKAWGQSGDPSTTDRMWRVYEQMVHDDVEPNIGSYTNLIFSLTQSGEEKDLQRADDLLAEMEQTNRKSIGPDFLQYNQVQNGWLAIGNADRAGRVFIRRTEAYIEGKNRDLVPSPNDIHSIVQAWINAGDLLHAFAFLDKMQELFHANLLPKGPKFFTATMLHEAWCRSCEPKKAIYLSRLEKLMEQLKH